MKKKMMVSFFVMLVLAAVGLGVLHKVRAKVPESIVEIALDKQHIWDSSQQFEAQGIPDYIVKRFDGKQAFFMEQLDNTMDDVQALLTEIRTAFVEGQVKGTYNPFWKGTNATLKTPTAEIRTYMISDDGTYSLCTKITYSNGKELKKETLVFHGDNKTLRSYRAPGRLLSFMEDGGLSVFSVSIEGKKHVFGWDFDGKLIDYSISDISQNPSEKN